MGDKTYQTTQSKTYPAYNGTWITFEETLVFSTQLALAWKGFFSFCQKLILKNCQLNQNQNVILNTCIAKQWFINTNIKTIWSFTILKKVSCERKRGQKKIC